MNIHCNDFFSEMVALYKGFEQAKLDCESYWSPDEPPLTTLFSSLGRKVCEDFWSIDVDIKIMFFEKIEAAMNSEDNDLRIAVATGLIEAMVAKSFDEKELWLSMSGFFGKKTSEHINGWLKMDL